MGPTTLELLETKVQHGEPLTLDERVKWLVQRDLDEENADLEKGIVTRGQPPYDSVESFKRTLAIWLPNVDMTDDWVHNRLDQAGVPRDQLDIRLAWLKVNWPEVYTTLQSFKYVEANCIEQWLDDNNVPK